MEWAKQNKNKQPNKQQRHSTMRSWSEEFMDFSYIFVDCQLRDTVAGMHFGFS